MTQPKGQKPIFADPGNRAGAILLDLMLVTFVISMVPIPARLAAIATPFFALLYFSGMPLGPLQGTPGKWICRIKICTRRGQRLNWRASAVRAFSMLCWCGVGAVLSRNDLNSEIYGTAGSIFWLLFLLPFAPMGFLPRRESLFDLLAGSLVVRYSADTDAIAQAEPAQKPGILNVSGTILLCLLCGLALSTVISVQRDMDRRARIGYAIAQTQSIREKVEAFHLQEQRWPTADALGIAEWTPYPAGGGYRLQADGSILVSFTVLPDLKGHSLALRPTPATDGKKIHWECRPDAGFARRFLPANCR